MHIRRFLHKLLPVAMHKKRVETLGLLYVVQVEKEHQWLPKLAPFLPLQIPEPYQTFYVDSIHRKLAVYPRGKYSHVQGYWVVGTHSPYSWDSRYYGQISEYQILFKLKPLLTWN
jgi:hypothetical protein